MQPEAACRLEPAVTFSCAGGRRLSQHLSDNSPSAPTNSLLITSGEHVMGQATPSLRPQVIAV